MTTLYAQSTGNWDAINWNTAANGSGSNQTPAAGDTLVSNSYTVTVNGNYTVTKVTNTSGGTFTLANGVTLTCTDGTAGVVGDYASVGAVTFALTGVGESATLISSVKGGDASNKWGINFSGTRTLNITGNITGGSSANARGVYVTGAGTCNIIGNLTANSAEAFYTNAAVTADIAGNITGAAQNGVLIAGAAIINVTGNVTGGSVNNMAGINSTSTAAITISGNITGGSVGGFCNGVYLSGASIIAHTGNIYASATACGIVNTHASAIVSATGEMVAQVGFPAIHCGLTGTAKAAGTLRAATNGTLAVYAINFFWRSGTNGLSIELYKDTSPITLKTLYSGDVHPDLPSPSNVRYGTTYGPSNEATGTCRIPAASSVAYGALVDNTTGTAVLTAEAVTAAVWDTLVADLDTANSIGARLAQAATVPSTGAQIAALGV